MNFEINTYIFLLTTVLVYMSAWFLIALIRKRNDVADVAWGLGFLVVALTSLYISADYSARKILIVTLVAIWSLRLSTHIYLRNRGKTEDYRYNQWRQEWGRWFYLRSYLQVFLLQGFLLFIVSAPVMLINKNSVSDLNLLDVLGILIWLAGFYFEALGDYQLSKFIKDPSNKGKLMMSGLWKYTRHPNYFGEVTQWWGIFVVALSVNYGWLSIIGPITITFLILKVSGIPMLEKKMETHPDFPLYKKQTSEFFPMFVK